MTRQRVSEPLRLFSIELIVTQVQRLYVRKAREKKIHGLVEEGARQVAERVSVQLEAIEVWARTRWYQCAEAVGPQTAAP